MKKQLLFIFLLLCCTAIHAQTNDLWEKVNVTKTQKSLKFSDQDKLYYKLNENVLNQKISGLTNKTSKKTTLEVAIPNTKGVVERFLVWEASNFEPELQAKYPEIRAFEGTGLDDKTAKIYFSIAPIGFQSMVFRSDKASEFIDKENTNEYVLYTSKNREFSNSLVCKTKEDNSKKKSGKTAKTVSNAKLFKTYRLAVSCTGEYATYFGGTKAGALAGINATLTRVNGVFKRDLAVELELISNNDEVIFTNSSTDPYSNPSIGASGAWTAEVQNTLTTIIGESNYDIGHLFGGSGGGGDANCIGCICVDFEKGSGFSSPSDGNPKGHTFDIDFVAHEFGHQLGGSHTFSYSIEGTGVNVEPGSGSTIMGYAGITGEFDIQNTSDDYFTYASILEIQNNLATKTCGVSTATTNNPPVISAGTDFTIPINTAFVLTGTGSDPDGDAITFCWEQNDSAITTSGTNSFTYPAKPDGPMFRSLPPSPSPIRYMPSFNSVLQNKLTTKWESVSSVARNLNFTLTARDNAALGTPQTNTDNMVVTVNVAVGPFVITSQNTNDIGWQKGSYQNINWNVNKTHTLPGSSNVNIKLSTDGGLSFPIVLASNTPNDGSETVMVPLDISATNCRVLIEPTANIYYAINSNPFAIGYTSSTTCNTYNFTNSPFDIPFGSSFTSKTAVVPNSTGIISDVNVSVNVTHERFSDLEIQIVNPQGVEVKLFEKNCGSSNTDLILNFDDAGVPLDCSLTTTQIVLPEEALSVFNGQSPQGNWVFKVRDAISGRFGTVNSASITICSQTFTLDDSEFETTDFALHPNPNNGSFNVQFDCDTTKEVKVYVHDILGQIVYERTFDKAPYFKQEIQLKHPSLGLHFLTLINGDKRIVKKILIN